MCTILVDMGITRVFIRTGHQLLGGNMVVPMNYGCFYEPDTWAYSPIPIVFVYP